LTKEVDSRAERRTGSSPSNELEIEDNDNKDDEEHADNADNDTLFVHPIWKPYGQRFLAARNEAGGRQQGGRMAALTVESFCQSLLTLCQYADLQCLA
jgi:hypothetical protein